MGIAVRQLRPEDERSHFHSGNIDLDRFFQKYAGQNRFRHHIGTTCAAVDGIGNVFAVERAATGEHLVQHRAECPNVRSPINTFSLRLLGTHVSSGAEDDTDLRSLRRLRLPAGASAFVKTTADRFAKEGWRLR